MRRVKEYDRQMKSEQKESAELAEAQQRDKVDKFMKAEKGVVLAYKRPGDEAKREEKPSASNVQDASKQINNFWIPTNTPEAKASKLKRPDTNIYCPITGEVLKAKDLVPVKFTLIDPEDSEKNLHSKKVSSTHLAFLIYGS